MSHFETLGLKSEIVQAVSDLGFVTPTPIQAKAIPYVLTNTEDLVALAQTGTGKTAAFSLPIIQQVEEGNRQTQALILCPTRELCIQITNDVKSYIKYLSSIQVIAVYGGEKIEKQLSALKRGGQIVVGTPGRVCDMIKRRKLLLGNINWLVLDEADEMLTMGFKEELEQILAETSDEKQTLLFSATMQKGIDSMVRKYMDSPTKISMGKRNEAAANISHLYFMVEERRRYAALGRILDWNKSIYGIVFCRTRRETQEVADRLNRDGYRAEAIHGDLSQAHREKVMRRFREKTIHLLVATDVAARGIDVNDLTHVINYNLPDYLETYVHRIGRTGRAGKEGTAISIINRKERNRISIIERKLGKKIERSLLPSGSEVYKSHLFRLIDSVEHVEVEEERMNPYLAEMEAKLEWLDKGELLKRFLSLELKRTGTDYTNLEDLNVQPHEEYGRRERRRDRDGRERPERNGRRDRERGSKRNRVQFQRFYINAGAKQDLTPVRLISLINRATRKKNIEIGKIEILRNFSFFEVDESYQNDLVDGMKKVDLDGGKVMIERTKPKKKTSRSRR